MRLEANTRHVVLVVVAMLITIGALGTVAAAQRRSAAVVEGSAGWAGFGDEGLIHHSTYGVAYRANLTRRLAIGPELIVMQGPGVARDVFLTANILFDIVGDIRVVPYVVAGVGLMFYRFGTGVGPLSGVEGAFSAGGGARFPIDDRWHVAAEARIGWEPHLRITGLVGYRFGR